MADPPLKLLDNENLGPEKTEADLTLLNLERETLGSPNLLNEKRLERNPKLNEDTNVGPEKSDADLTLLRLVDPLDDVILSDAAREFPLGQGNEFGSTRTGSVAKLQQRRSIEDFLGLGGNVLDSDESLVGNQFHETQVERFQRVFKKEGDQGSSIRFESIEDANLSASQMARFERLVASGEIDPNVIFDNSSIASVFGSLGIPSTHLGSITMLQAVEIVIGNSREGISQFDPNTGLPWDPRDLRIAQRLQKEILRRQGLPQIFTANTLRGVGPNQFLFQRRPESESKLDPRATDRSRITVRNDFLNYNLTLEESLRVAELISGRSRLFENPGDPSGPNFDETLLYGDFVL